MHVLPLMVLYEWMPSFPAAGGVGDGDGGGARGGAPHRASRLPCQQDLPPGVRPRQRGKPRTCRHKRLESFSLLGTFQHHGPARHSGCHSSCRARAYSPESSYYIDPKLLRLLSLLDERCRQLSVSVDPAVTLTQTAVSWRLDQRPARHEQRCQH